MLPNLDYTCENLTSFLLGLVDFVVYFCYNFLKCVTKITGISMQIPTTEGGVMFERFIGSVSRYASTLGGSVIVVVYMSNYLFSYHPLITDDSGVQGRGRYQYEFNFDYGYDKTAGLKTYDLLLTNTFTYGFNDSTDIFVNLPYLCRKENSRSDRGISDVDIGFKYAFYRRDDFGLALKPSIILPTGEYERGLGSGKSSFNIFLIADKNLKDINVFFNLGYIANRNKLDEKEDLLHISIASDYRLKDDLKLVSNIKAETNPDKTSNKYLSLLLIGAVYSYSEDLDISFGVRRSLTEPETDLGFTSGITLRF